MPLHVGDKNACKLSEQINERPITKPHLTNGPYRDETMYGVTRYPDIVHGTFLIRRSRNTWAAPPIMML